MQIYDESESLWLVEVVPGEGQYAGHGLLDDRAWRALAPKLQVLQINSAIMGCQFDRRWVLKMGIKCQGGIEHLREVIITLHDNDQCEESCRYEKVLPSKLGYPSLR